MTNEQLAIAATNLEANFHRVSRIWDAEKEFPDTRDRAAFINCLLAVLSGMVLPAEWDHALRAAQDRTRAIIFARERVEQ